jgi:hypothetical protein
LQVRDDLGKVERQLDVAPLALDVVREIRNTGVVGVQASAIAQGAAKLEVPVAGRQLAGQAKRRELGRAPVVVGKGCGRPDGWSIELGPIEQG